MSQAIDCFGRIGDMWEIIVPSDFDDVKWSATTLGQLMTFANGRSSPKRSDGLDFPVYGSNGIIGYCDRTNAAENTIVIGRVGTYCGSLQFSSSTCWVTDNAIRAEAKEGNDARFLYYLLQTLRLNEWRSGSGQPLLNQSTLSSIPTEVPPVREQLAIARVLGTLDDKVELNGRMTQTLEELARAIFKDWFIDFGPTRAKMEGRDSYLSADVWNLFPDCLVDSELGAIPVGWEVTVLEDVSNVSTGKRPGHRFAVASEDAQIPLWGGNGPMAFVAEPLVNSPVLLTGRVGTLGSVFRITTPCWPSDNTLIVKAKSTEFFHYLFFQMERVDFHSLNRGSTQPLVTQSDLKRQLVILPTGSALEWFDRLATVIFDSIDLRGQQSRALAAQRDALLPKLVSGELKVRTN